MARVVVIEDEPDLQEVVCFNLEDARHEVRAAADAATGLRLAREHRAEVVLLDLMLPDGSGLDVCRTLRQDPTTRDAVVIMLTAKGEEVDRVVGFELGADDYVTKPFSMRELLLRIQAHLRKRPRAAPQLIEHGVLRIDRTACRVWVREREIELAPMELRLLVHLYERRDTVQGREALLAEVWGLRGDVVSRTVDTHVKRLREKLGDAGEYLQTVRGWGYRFAAAGGAP